MHVIPSPNSRVAVRRAVIRPCLAVVTDGYKLLSQRILDLSPRGMLVWGSPTTGAETAAGATTGAESSTSGSGPWSAAPDLKLGDEVFVTFKAPGDGLWMNVETEVTRIIRGARRSDLGPCIGLRFKDLNGSRRSDLVARLTGIPPTIPQRPLRWRSGPCRRLRISGLKSIRPPISTFRAARVSDRQLVLPADEVLGCWHDIQQSIARRGSHQAPIPEIQLRPLPPPPAKPPESTPRGVWTSS